MYGVFLTIKFGTNLLWLAFAQFAGDMVGSLVLSASVSKRGALWRNRLFGNLRVNLITMMILFGLTFVGFAHSQESVAIFSQVVMGTLYVLLIQTCTELIEESCQGNAALYKRCSLLLEAVYTAAVLVSNGVGLALYELLGADTIIYTCAALCAAYVIFSSFIFVMAGHKWGGPRGPDVIRL